MSSSPTGAASTSATASAFEIVSMIGLIYMRVCEMKGLDLGEESLHLGFHCGVGIIGGSEFGFVLGGGGCAFVLFDLEARHHLIYVGVGVVEAQFVNSSAVLPDLKVRLSEVVFEVIPCFVRRVGVFPHLDVVFENSLFLEDNEGEVYCLTLG